MPLVCLPDSSEDEALLRLQRAQLRYVRGVGAVMLTAAKGDTAVPLEALSRIVGTRLLCTTKKELAEARRLLYVSQRRALAHSRGNIVAQTKVCI
jgi:hypothetical protein